MHCNSTTTILVPTKTEDNCSYASMMPNHVEQQVEETKFDAFQHYSSDLLRLQTLLLSPDHDDDELSALAAVNDILRRAGLSDITARNHVSKDDSKRRRGNNSQPIKQNEAETQPQRKTRLSWEVHPDLLLQDLYEDGEDIHFISDDEDDYVTSLLERLQVSHQE